MHSLVLVVHGGAGNLRAEAEPATRAGVERALASGWEILKAGGSSKDAVERVIVLLENDPVFDAGVGAHLNRDGNAQLDAILMDGSSLKSGAVAAVERVRNPIQLARRILDHSAHALFVGTGAEQFAVDTGIPLCDPKEFITPYEYQRWLDHSRNNPPRLSQGTVGAAARDVHGNLCAGTSTGGTFLKTPGRVGDSPLIGCGCYADNESAAVSCTGHGESIMKVVMAKAAADYVAAGRDAQSAADTAIQVLSRKTGGTGGLIVVDKMGRVGVSFSTPHMTWTSKAE